MKNKDILDRSGQKIGRVIDFHFNVENDKFTLKSIVMGGSRIEEFLESIGVKKDIDPFFSLDVIDRYENDQLHLKVDYEKLTEPVKLGENEKLLTDLSNCTIIDSDKNKIGNIIDVVFDEKGKPWFVIGGGFFEEFSERIGLRPDIDLLVPQEFVSSMSTSEMCIKYSKYQLSTTAQEEWEKHKRDLVTKPKIEQPRHRFIWLGAPPTHPPR
jgi:sporulation protein YlmC with PRC-barrel domain